MNLKGKAARDVQAGARLTVWYNEEQDAGHTFRVAYSGVATHYSRTEGVRVWLDGFSAEEQEWVNDGDEWAWEEAALAGLQGPFDAVRLRLRGAAVPPSAAKADSAAALCSVLSNPSADRSPRKFNKKARMLQAGGSSFAEPAAEADVPADPLPGPAAAAASPDAAHGLAESAAAAGGAAERGAGRPAKQAGRRGAASPAAAPCEAEAPPPSKVPPKRAHRPQQEAEAVVVPMVGMRVGAAGVSLYVPSAQAAALAGLVRQTAPPPPPSEEDKYGICKHSGLVARYLDPATGARYGSAEALRSLRAEAEAAAGAGGGAVEAPGAAVVDGGAG